jgi:hypothetical protein
LDKANKLALKGRHREADPTYQKILQQHQEHPGVLYNQALANLEGQDPALGASLLSRSLKACPNYQPSQNLVEALSPDE